jgi:hypothetical protein
MHLLLLCNQAFLLFHVRQAEAALAHVAEIALASFL